MRFGTPTRLAFFYMLIAFLAPPASADHESSQKRSVVDFSQKELHRFFPELSGLKFDETQTNLPVVLEKVGQNVNALLNNVPNLSSEEDVVREQLEHDISGRERGVPQFSGKYNYVVLAHKEGDGVRLVEYRTDFKGKNKIRSNTGNEASSLTQGFALIPLHFHPFHQAAARFRYLGLQVVYRHGAYVIAFAQQPDKAQLTGQVNIGGKTSTIAYQGIAWIDASTFQIVRMRTDLLEPRPDIGLLAQTTEVNFTEVHIATITVPLWLPKSVVVTTLVNGRILRTEHSYSNYRKFGSESRIVVP